MVYEQLTYGHLKYWTRSYKNIMKALEDVDILVKWGFIHVDVGTHDIFVDMCKCLNQCSSLKFSFAF